MAGRHPPHQRCRHKKRRRRKGTRCDFWQGSFEIPQAGLFRPPDARHRHRRFHPRGRDHFSRSRTLRRGPRDHRHMVRVLNATGDSGAEETLTNTRAALAVFSVRHTPPPPPYPWSPTAPPKAGKPGGQRGPRIQPVTACACLRVGSSDRTCHAGLQRIGGISSFVHAGRGLCDCLQSRWVCSRIKL